MEIYSGDSLNQERKW